MKIATFETSGRMGYGIVEGDEIIDVSAVTGNAFPDLKSVIASGNMEAALAPGLTGNSPRYKLADVVLKPVIPNPDKIICVGLNYEMHRQETGRDESTYPVLFTRFANTQIGHGEPLVKPRQSDKFDYEGELAVIIGKTARHVEEADALDHIAGYACYNDGSVRDWQRHTHQFTPGKNFPATGPFGPWMVTADEIADPTKLELTTRLNGEVMQSATVDEMIFSIQHQISYCSHFTELVPGDVIVTGTPGGVGARRDPPVFMKPGDLAEVEISGIGTLANRVVTES